MKGRAKPSAKAWTLIELLVVVMVIGVFLLMLVPPSSAPRKAKAIICLNNLHLIGLSLQWFSEDHDNFPAQVSVTNGGALELAGSNRPAAACFRTVDSYLVNPHLLRCPFDSARTTATNFQTLSNGNVSYFLSLDATRALTNAILVGDRNLAIDGKAVQSGLLRLATNATVQWTCELHPQYQGAYSGNLLFADLHVERLHTNLNLRVRDQGLGTNRLVVP